MAARKELPPPTRPLIAINTDYLTPKNGIPYARLNAGYIDAFRRTSSLRTIRLQRRRRIAGTRNGFFTALSRSRPTRHVAAGDRWEI